MSKKMKALILCIIMLFSAQNIDKVIYLERLTHISQYSGAGVFYTMIQVNGVNYRVRILRHGEFAPSELKKVEVSNLVLRQTIKTGYP